VIVFFRIVRIFENMRSTTKRILYIKQKLIKLDDHVYGLPQAVNEAAFHLSVLA